MSTIAERWWIITIRTARKRKKEVTARADTEVDARLLACPGRGDTILSVKECSAFNAKISSMLNRTLSRPAIYEALGDCASLLKVGVPFQDAIRLQLPKISSPLMRYELFMVSKALVTQGPGCRRPLRAVPASAIPAWNP